jgi:copper homeostasis protein
MVRPRTGDFVYSEEEVNVMLQDISVFKQYGVQGVVFGALTAAGDVDESLVREWVPTSFRKVDINFETGLLQRQYP